MAIVSERERRYSTFALVPCVVDEGGGKWVERTLNVESSFSVPHGLVKLESKEGRFRNHLEVISIEKIDEPPKGAVDLTVRKVCRIPTKPHVEPTSFDELLSDLRSLRCGKGSWMCAEDDAPDDDDQISVRKQKTPITYTNLRDAITVSKEVLLATYLGPKAIFGFLRDQARCGVDPERLGSVLSSCLSECPWLPWAYGGERQHARLVATLPAFPKCPATNMLLAAAEAGMEGHTYAVWQEPEVTVPDPPWPELVVDRDSVYLGYVHRAETELARLLAGLAKDKSQPEPSQCGVFAFTGKAANRASEAIADWGQRYDSGEAYDLHPEQQEAVTMALTNRISIIQGAAGSGKTTVLAEIVRRLGGSGRARTMHSVIHGSPRDAFPTGRATVIIDEASMADILTVHRFLHALQHAGVEIFRIVLVGDTHQLPPIRHASVQRALLDAECIPKMTMTASQFRQSSTGSGQGILRAATEVARWEGLFEAFFAEESLIPSVPDFLVHWVDTAASVGALYRPEKSELQAACDAALVHAQKRSDSGDFVQVLCATNAACEMLNGPLRDLYNPSGRGGTERISGWIYREGDQVMSTKNLYVRGEPGEESTFFGSSKKRGPWNLAVGNGEVGRVVETGRKHAVVAFCNERIRYSIGVNRSLNGGRTRPFDVLTPAYAVTVHKYQGSECDHLIYVHFSWRLDFATRNLLYTAITRAKKTAVVVGSKSQLNACGKWSKPSRTNIGERICEHL